MNYLVTAFQIGEIITKSWLNLSFVIWPTLKLSIQKQSSLIPLASGTKSLLPATSATQPSLTKVILEVLNAPAFYWVGVQYLSPLPTGFVANERVISWRLAVSMSRIFTGIFSNVHRQLLLLENHSNLTVSVVYKVYRVEET